MFSFFRSYFFSFVYVCWLLLVDFRWYRVLICMVAVGRNIVFKHRRLQQFIEFVYHHSSFCTHIHTHRRAQAAKFAKEKLTSLHTKENAGTEIVVCNRQRCPNMFRWCVLLLLLFLCRCLFQPVFLLVFCSFGQLYSSNCARVLFRPYGRPLHQSVFCWWCCCCFYICNRLNKLMQQHYISIQKINRIFFIARQINADFTLYTHTQTPRTHTPKTTMKKKQKKKLRL